ncbi:hypothetical protein SAMN04488074_107243 [Lentzea albidocapillata subsp. violacea]|uniref:Uncharacterized protein n=1 Tax=Lentzea albidocapillata subsp. violacea TaxID=128104 RepID=A0A1G9F3D7_9PSEU|nr:hypothetical protein SAMN04488074_107243 [Lentzea albidocapillata subsp. violacea]
MARWGETQFSRHQGCVKEPAKGVKLPSDTPDVRVFAMHASPVKTTSLSGRERVMADLAYALLLIGSFLVLGLTVRGLEKL